MENEKKIKNSPKKASKIYTLSELQKRLDTAENRGWRKGRADGIDEGREIGRKELAEEIRNLLGVTNCTHCCPDDED